MYSKFCRVVWAIALIFWVPCLSGPAAAEESKAAGQQQPVTTLNLSVSPDGRSLVDQNGKEVARFKEGMRVSRAKAGEKM